MKERRKEGRKEGRKSLIISTISWRGEAND
jgi:hypothetical protein